MPASALFAVLTVLLAIAVTTDLRARRIPNWLTVGGTVLALGIGAVQVGGVPTQALVGLGVALCLGFPLFALRGIGAGDAKLLAMVGAFVGPGVLLSVVLYAGIAGGILAAFSAIRRGVILPVLIGSKELALHLVTFGRLGSRRSLDMPGAHTVPYGVAIAAGTVAAWFFPVLLAG